MSVVQDVQPQTLADSLRELAEVLDANRIQVEYVGFRNREVSLFEDDFKQLFKGETIKGTRSNSFVHVSAEKFGFTWTASIFSPYIVAEAEVEIQI